MVKRHEGQEGEGVRLIIAFRAWPAHGGFIFVGGVGAVRLHYGR